MKLAKIRGQALAAQSKEVLKVLVRCDFNLALAATELDCHRTQLQRIIAADKKLSDALAQYRQTSN